MIGESHPELASENLLVTRCDVALFSTGLVADCQILAVSLVQNKVAFRGGVSLGRSCHMAPNLRFNGVCGLILSPAKYVL